MHINILYCILYFKYIKDFDSFNGKQLLTIVVIMLKNKYLAEFLKKIFGSLKNSFYICDIQLRERDFYEIFSLREFITRFTILLMERCYYEKIYCYNRLCCFSSFVYVPRFLHSRNE
jgi:hypothetical protein